MEITPFWDNPFSILMFCFSGALILYAALLALTKDYRLIPRHYAVKVKDEKAYARKMAKVIALVAVAPLHCGLGAMFSVPLAMVVLVAEIIMAIWIGTEIMK